MNEGELIQRCRRGERDAQRDLYERTSQRIYRLLLRMTGSPDDALDLAQEAYVRAFTRIEQFDGRSSLATWLYRIAVTEGLQFLRRAKRNRTLFSGDAANRSIGPTTGLSNARLDLADALAVLEPTDRTMLLLRYQEGLDYRTIAEVANCAEGTVASRLHRARDRLRVLLGTGCDPREERHPAGHQMNRGQARTEPRPAANEKTGERAGKE